MSTKILSAPASASQNLPSFRSGLGNIPSPGGGQSNVRTNIRVTPISASSMRFLIMDAPRQGNLHLYMREMKRNNVTDIVRVCEPTYETDDLKNAGITLHDMAYDDGTSPPDLVLDKWLEVVKNRFFNKNKLIDVSVDGGGACVQVNRSSSDDVTSSPAAVAPDGKQGQPAIAVHCIAGLGRAPVLVAIALIEYANYDPVSAVSFIRNHRRGAINGKQLVYLESYKRRTKRLDGGCACTIM